jgi:hypothetical protein
MIKSLGSLNAYVVGNFVSSICLLNETEDWQGVEALTKAKKRLSFECHPAVLSGARKMSWLVRFEGDPNFPSQYPKNDDISKYRWARRKPKGWMFWGSSAGRGLLYVWPKGYGSIDSQKYTPEIAPLNFHRQQGPVIF